MKFEIFINDPVIHKAANLVEKHHCSPWFITELIFSGSFNYTEDSAAKVANRVLTSFSVMNIVPYKTWSPWSKVIGYAKGDTIYVNTRKLDLPLKDRVENFMHEPLHLLGYSHKGNKNNEFNRGTVPYKVASIFVKYLESIGEL